MTCQINEPNVLETVDNVISDVTLLGQRGRDSKCREIYERYAKGCIRMHVLWW